MKLSGFKVNTAASEEGDWVENIPDAGGLRIKTRGVNNRDYQKLMQRLVQAIPRKDRMSNQIDPQTMNQITARCLHECALQDWDGLEDDEGNPVPYSSEAAKVYLTDPQYRLFREAALWAAQAVENSNREQVKDITKN